MRLRYKPWANDELFKNDLIFFDPLDKKGKWNEEFKNNNPINLEIGAGYGKFAIEKARVNQNENHLAIEMESNVLVYAARDFLLSKLKNIRAIRTMAENIPLYIGENEISKIYINFPNPWPKKKQNKRRLTHTKQLNMYKNILKDGGIIEFKTDHRGFFNDSLEYFKEAGYEIIYKSFALKLDEIEDNIVTEYEKKWRDLETPICYLKAILKK